LNTMLFIEMYTLNRAWTDLTDDEFFWEPVPGCWSVSRRSQGLTPTPFGKGEWVADFDADLAGRANLGEATEPLTTVAWLMWHIGSMPGRMVELDFFAGMKSAESGWALPYIADHPVFSSADEAVQTMRTGWRALDRELQVSTDEQLERQTRFWDYPGPGPGDEILATFDGPGRAVRCAISLREAMRTLAIEIRTGIHTGEIELRGTEISGLGVHVAARVREHAGPGEVLVSGAVPLLMVGSGVEFEPRGEWGLKGVPGEWPLFALKT
jgi:hypothetical protein